MKNKPIILKIIIYIVAIIIFSLLLLTINTFINGKQIKVNDKLIIDLYSYLGENDLTYCDGLMTYQKGKTTYADLDEPKKLCNALASLYLSDQAKLIQIDKKKKNNVCQIGDSEQIVFATDNYEDEVCSVYRLNKEEVLKRYQQIYNQDIKNYEAIQINNSNICYPDGEYYYCGLSETYTVTVGSVPKTYRNIKKAIQKDDIIKITDYFLKIENDKCYQDYANDLENDECSKITNKDQIDYKFLKKYGTVYEHTFKKSQNGTYYWVETESK